MSPNQTKANACDGKQAHDAETARLIARKSKQVILGAYRCPFCQAWHVGGDRNRTKKAIRRKLQEIKE